MQGSDIVSKISWLGVLALLPVACNKQPTSSEAAASAAPTTAPALAASVAAPAAGAPLAGLDPCLVGSWKSTSFGLKTDQVTAEGGANLALKVEPAGDAVVDFGPMAPIQGKTGGASFDFQYSGQAKATLKTPARGALESSNADYAALKVSVNVELPGAGKLNLFKAKPVSALAQMASAVVGGKAPAGAGAPPPGIDSSPIFSTSRYSCEGDTLTLDGDKLAAKWSFARVTR